MQFQQNFYKSLRLWYNNPAEDWNQALPIGNGRLGGMVYGNVCREEVQLNEDSIWYGNPIDRNNPDSKKNLPKILLNVTRAAVFCPLQKVFSY